MQWHLQQWGKAEDAVVKDVHEELFKRDQDTLDELKEEYDQRRKRFKTRHNLDIPELKFEE